MKVYTRKPNIWDYHKLKGKNQLPRNKEIGLCGIETRADLMFTQAPQLSSNIDIGFYDKINRKWMKPPNPDLDVLISFHSKRNWVHCK